MTSVVLTGEDLPLPGLVAIADGAPVLLSDAGMARLAAGQAVLEAALARGDGVYGTTSMVGAFKDNPVAPEDRPNYALRLAQSHCLGVGAALPVRVVRAAMAARLNALLGGHTGASPGLAHGLRDLLNAGITPIVPEYGSIGCADVGLMGHVGAALMGEGQALGPEGGAPMAVRILLRRHNLAPMSPGPKDMMSVLSSNAVGVAGVALVAAELRARLPLLLGVYSLSCAGFGAFGIPWEAARRTGMAAEIRIARFLQRINPPGGWTPRRNLQDPLSFRCMPQIGGAFLATLDRVEIALAHGLARCDDNPILLDGRAMTSGASLPLTLALDAQALVLALCHYVRGVLGRILALCREDLSGLPRNLTFDPGRQVAFGAATKLAADLSTAILRESTPASLYQVPVANGFEDEASYLPSIARALRLQCTLLHPLVALEAMAARQAVRLSGATPGGLAGEIMARLACDTPWLDDGGAVADAVARAETALAAVAGRLAADPAPEFRHPDPAPAPIAERTHEDA
ncbi:aromatic amino acid lyase [Nguyenibacter sp. L1]|nr:aromatic amino acid lyase [Nguyenibacter sp. L1]WRH87000.1 aromatic amino acid lyase [Nguyenibacter sp. L1]